MAWLLLAVFVVLAGLTAWLWLEQVKRQIVGLREHGLPRNLLLEWQRPNVFTSSAGLDAVVILHGRRTEHIENQRELVVV